MHLYALNPARLAESFVSEALYGRYHWHSLGKDNKKEILTICVQDNSFRTYLGQYDPESGVVGETKYFMISKRPFDMCLVKGLESKIARLWKTVARILR